MPRRSYDTGGVTMWPSARTIAILLTLGLASGGAALGVNALLASSGDPGTDYGLDTDANGRFDWLVVEAQVVLPDAGTWDVYASLSADSIETNACGYGYRLAPTPLMDAGSSPMPFAWTYERYFFPAGAQTVRMAFDGEDIVRAGAEGPPATRARRERSSWRSHSDRRPSSRPRDRLFPAPPAA